MPWKLHEFLQKLKIGIFTQQLFTNFRNFQSQAIQCGKFDYLKIPISIGRNLINQNRQASHLECPVSGKTRITLLDEIRATHSSDRWPEFFSNYGDLLSQWLVAQNVPSADADDIRQETMLVVLKELPNFDHNGRTGAFRNWLKQILTNRLRRHWEKKKSRKEQNDLVQLIESLEDNSNRLSIDFGRTHDQFLVQQLLERAEEHFPVERVQLFRELVLDEIAIQDLSSKYGLSKGTIRVQQHRILKWLKHHGTGMIDMDELN